MKSKLLCLLTVLTLCLAMIPTNFAMAAEDNANFTIEDGHIIFGDTVHLDIIDMLNTGASGTTFYRKCSCSECSVTPNSTHTQSWQMSLGTGNETAFANAKSLLETWGTWNYTFFDTVYVQSQTDGHLFVTLYPSNATLSYSEPYISVSSWSSSYFTKPIAYIGDTQVSTITLKFTWYGYSTGSYNVPSGEFGIQSGTDYEFMVTKADNADGAKTAMLNTLDTSKTVYMRTADETGLGSVFMKARWKGQGTLAGLTAEMELNPLKEILKVLPMAIACLVGYVGLRKGLAILQAILHQA